MDSTNKDIENIKKVDANSESQIITKDPDLKKLITKVDNRVKTKVIYYINLRTSPKPKVTILKTMT